MHRLNLPRMIIMGMLLLVSCASPPGEDLQISPVSPTNSSTESGPVHTGTIPEQADILAAYTYQQADGNRFLPGKGTIRNSQPLDIPLTGRPIWLVAAPLNEGSIWVAVLADGNVQAFLVSGRIVESAEITPARLPVGMPPMLIIEKGLPQLLTNPAEGGSTLSHPVRFSESVLYLTQEGDLVAWENAEVGRLALNILRDARLLEDEFGRLLFLGDPTGDYGHAVLGDALEARSITLVETSPSLRVVNKILIPAPDVIEGIAPIWTDITGDGKREIIVTLSNAQEGARIVVYDEEGAQVAMGPSIGQGSRWRHQLVVAPFGPAGELELVDVLTPHIGGVVEFYQLVGERLEIVARVPGYSSHVIGSRNLDQALAGDFDGDGSVELLVPNRAQEMLGAIRRTNDGAQAVWTLSIGGRLSTNLAGVTLPDGGLLVGVGREDNILRLWLP